MTGTVARRNVTPLSRAATLPVRAARIPVGPCVALGLVVAYGARASLIAYIGTQWTIELISLFSITGLILGGAHVASGGILAVQWRGVLMIAAGAASLRHCETISFALARWGGWALMLMTVGPVLSTPLAIRFRHSTMEALRTVIVAATLVSAAWWLVGLPNLGRGDFTGVMWHSMTLGPLAALAGIIALSRAISRAAVAWYGVVALAAGVAMLAASRSALAGFALGAMLILALKFKRRPLLSGFALVAGLFAACVPDAALGLVANVAPDSFVTGLARKSWEHTREAHWDARWEEFLFSPLTGVGFACGWDGTAGYNEESGAIETGSSYLSILSMTGVVGAAAFLLVVSKPAVGTLRNWRVLNERTQLEVVGFAGFWAVHLGAEGYVYGVGSLLGLAFWLWLGWLGDQTTTSNVRGPR